MALHILDHDGLADLLQGVVAKARGTAWDNATRAAVHRLDRDGLDGTVHLVGDEAVVKGRSGAYIVGTGEATCSCPAGRNRKPCWHRAAARIVRRAVERGMVVRTIPNVDAEALFV